MKISSIFGLWFIFFNLVLMPSLTFAKEAAKEPVKETVETIKKGEYRGAKTAIHPNWFKESFLDLDDDIADAKANNKRLVLYFWQSGCPYCNQLWEDNFSQQVIEDQFRENFEVIAINMWGDRDVVSIAGKTYTEKSFSEALAIQYTPTLLFFDENKKVVHRLNGYIPPRDFKLSLAYVSGKQEKIQTFGEFSLHQKDTKNSEEQHAEKLHSEDFFSQADLNLGSSQQQQVKQKYLAVFFEATNCRDCDLLHEKSLKNPATRMLIKQFRSVQLNRYADTEIVTNTGEKTSAKAWANKLGISYLPAMLFFDPNGKEIMRIDAQMRTFHIQSVLEYVLSGAYKSEHNFQRYISARADKIREKGIDVDIWEY